MQHLVQLSWLVLALSGSVASADELEIRPRPVPPHHVDSKAPVDSKVPAPELLDAHALEDAAGRARDGVLPDGKGYLAGLSRREPYFDEPGDGSLWALGNTYKMGFDAGGATYVPFLGSDAPRSFPVRLRVRSVRTDAGEIAFERAALPSRDGRRVVYERGPFREVYDLGYEAVEQSFLVRERLGPGALVIELDVESELAPESDAHGLVLAGELGSVRYSSATLVDDRGARVAAPTRWRDGRIEIEVPAEELAGLRFPLLVDPVLTTFSIWGPGSPPVRTGFEPDVAYDASTRKWCVVHEREFSATDHDVFALQYAEDASWYYDFAIAGGVADWRHPRVANNRAAGQFLVVAETGTVGARRIRGRTLTEPAPDVPFQIGPLLTLSPAGLDAQAPDVGGDGGLATPSYYCVVWQRIFASDDHDILAQMVGTDSTLFGSTIPLSNTADTVDSYPSIGTSNGPGPSSQQIWTVAWHRAAGFGTFDLYAGRIRWDGAVISSPFALETGSVNARFATVSSPTADAMRHTLVAYSRGSVGNTNTWGYLLEGATVRAHANLTSVTGAPVAENQIYPSVDCDGRSFVLVETETIPSTTSYRMHASTLTYYGGDLVVDEGYDSLGVSGPTAPLPRVACAGASGGPPRRSFIVFHYEGFSPDPFLYGSFYDALPFSTFCDPGLAGVFPCPCGNPPSGPGRGCDNSSLTGGARLSASGSVQPDSVMLVATDMKPSALCLFVQASVLMPSGLVFGDGIVCTGGTAQRLGAKVASGGQASYPNFADPSITARSAALGDAFGPGSTRHYFVYYRDSASYACAEGFNATNAVRVLW